MKFFREICLAAAGLPRAAAGHRAAGRSPATQPAPAASTAGPSRAPAAIAAAREILAAKQARAIYTRRCARYRRAGQETLLQDNLDNQKDLNEVAVIVAQDLKGRENEIGDGMARSMPASSPSRN